MADYTNEIVVKVELMEVAQILFIRNLHSSILPSKDHLLGLESN